MNIKVQYGKPPHITPRIPLNERIRHYLLHRQIGYFLLLATLLLSSCIRDDLQPCPPLQVQITVKDKNYSNINNVSLETPKSETLAFREYIPTLYYALRNANTGDIVEEQGVFNVSGDESTFPITFCDCLPQGKYVLTVWGGLADNTTLVENSLTNIIHPNSLEGKDVYLAHDTIEYNAEHTNHVIEMERVTGKLIIQIINLPQNVATAVHNTGNIYSRVNYKFDYQNPGSVNKTNTWTPAPEIIFTTILAPSTGNQQSMEHLDLYASPSPAPPILTPKDVKITLKRNELTTLKYVYDEDQEDFYIYVLMNDGWETIHDLNIN